jgi:biopolymer transport protein TolQ
MNGDLSVIDIVLQASVPVQIVMAILLLMSVASWAVIIDKSRLIKQAVGAANNFEARFWSGVDLSGFYRDIAAKEKAQLGMGGIFEAGYREFGRLNEEGGLPTHELVEGARRAMNVSQMREVDRL